MPRFPAQLLVNFDRYIHHRTFARLHGLSKAVYGIAKDGVHATTAS
jgi:hypothetical protein